MKLIAIDDGDESVGIHSQTWEFESPEFGQDETENRKTFREEFKKFFIAWYDPVGKVSCWFEDECPDCGQFVENDKSCHNKNCINFYDEEFYKNEEGME
jgi:hypothetical protein